MYGTSGVAAIALLAFPWIPLVEAQAQSSTTEPSQSSPTTLTTSITSPSASTSSQSTRVSSSDPRLKPTTSTFTTSSSSLVASANPTGSTVPQTSKQIQQENQDNGLVNSYFAILALLVLFVFLGVWFLHRRRKRAKARSITGRQEALARDLDGWVRRDGTSGTTGNGQNGLVGRYWGHWRSWSDAYTRREEGLNERGEAPPAYSPRAISEEVARQRERREEEDERNLQIPLRTLSREEVPGLKPPEYAESVRRISLESEEGMPASATVSVSPAHPPLPRDGTGPVPR
ncbi:MAG: hypothetical protein Q9157_005091 [Trypethelium eluteriae]